MMPTARTATRRAPAKPARSALRLSVQCAERGAGLPTRAQVRAWVAAALEQPASVTVRFVGEAEGRELNGTWRGRDYGTNVLSFPYEEDFFGPGSGLCGDLVLCVPVVEREAAEQGKERAAHYAHLLVHGTLHLQGWDHEHEDEAQLMEQREREIMARLGYSDPYAAD